MLKASKVLPRIFCVLLDKSILSTSKIQTLLGPEHPLLMALNSIQYHFI